MDLPPFEPAYVELKNGQKMVIRPLKKEEAPVVLGVAKKEMEKVYTAGSGSRIEETCAGESFKSKRKYQTP